MPIGNKLGNPRRKHTRPMTKVGNENACCAVCGAVKTYKRLSSGYLETPSQFLKRKTCGREWNGSKWVAGDCYKEFISGKGNGNYKGYMPTCKICGKRTSYNGASENKRGNLPQYCGDCYYKIKVKEKKGIYPEHLKPYSFKKGSNPLSLHKDNCKCVVCKRIYDNP